jgi:thiamine-phosphate pyrophosphorylase
MTDPGLYLISPPRITASSFVLRLKEALEAGGVKAFQLRLKDAGDNQILEAANELLPLCRSHDIAFILNDRADLAVQCGADGVHLGQEDMKIADARAVLGPVAVIGMSCHASRDMAVQAAEQGADYVAFGAFYPTTSKPLGKIEKWGIPTPDIIEWWSTYTTVPCVAIGGITPQNCAPLVRAGADFIAVITGVWEHPKGPGEAVREFMAAMKKGISRP